MSRNTGLYSLTGKHKQRNQTRIKNISKSLPNIFLKALAPTLGRCATVSTRFVAKEIINQ